MNVELLVDKGGMVAIILLALSVFGLAILLLKLYHFQARGVLFLVETVVMELILLNHI